MEKNLYCSNCDNRVRAHLLAKDEEYEVKSDKFLIKADVFFCPRCNEELFDEEIDEANLNKVYDLYRKKYNLLTQREIKRIREKYSLSQRAISKLLGWGEVTYSRYENGAIQDTVHNEVIELINNPENMLEIYNKNNHFLPPHARKALEKKINILISADAPTNLILCIERFLSGDQIPNEYTGYKEFDLEKLKDIILYITSRSEIILKTKLNKLLWYIDFLFFKTYSVSLTGCTYVHLPFGPIPDNYDDILNLMRHEETLEKKEIVFSEEKGIIGEQLVAKIKIDKSQFTNDELRVINYIIDYFSKFNCVEIAKFSHNERPYNQTTEQDKISYELAKELSLELR